MDRPNTVAGLLAKRKELAALRSKLELDLKRVVCDLDHLDAAVLLFGADATPAAPGAVLPYRTAYRTPKGKLQRFVLAFLREAGGPATSKDITEAWMAARGLRTDDGTFVVLRKRVGACLVGLRAARLVRNGEGRGRYVGYELARDGTCSRSQRMD